MTSKKMHNLAIGVVGLVVLLGSGLYVYLQKNKNHMIPAPASVVVTYTDQGFSPTSITITDPTIVIFKNESSQPFQPVWNLKFRPSEQCIDGPYGDCKAIPMSGSWSQGFGFPGAWKYYDQMNPSHTMLINVLQGTEVGVPG